MAITEQEYDKLYEADKYFRTLYDLCERYIFVKKESDGKWHVHLRTYAADFKDEKWCGRAENDLGSYPTRKEARAARETARRKHIGIPDGAKLGQPMTYMSILNDGTDYAELNRKKDYVRL